MTVIMESGQGRAKPICSQPVITNCLGSQISLWAPEISVLIADAEASFFPTCLRAVRGREGSVPWHPNSYLSPLSQDSGGSHVG